MKHNMNQYELYYIIHIILEYLKKSEFKRNWQIEIDLKYMQYLKYINNLNQNNKYIILIYIIIIIYYTIILFFNIRKIYYSI